MSIAYTIFLDMVSPYREHGLIPLGYSVTIVRTMKHEKASISQDECFSVAILFHIQSHCPGNLCFLRRANFLL